MADYILLWFKCTHPSQTSPESPLFCPEISRPVRTINKWLVNKLNCITVRQHFTLGVLISPCLSKLGQNKKKRWAFTEVFKDFQPAFYYSAVNYLGIRKKKDIMCHKITCAFLLWEVKVQVSVLTFSLKKHLISNEYYMFVTWLSCLEMERAVVVELEGRRLPGRAKSWPRQAAGIGCLQETP